jgi:ankyrin repeat protein
MTSLDEFANAIEDRDFSTVESLIASGAVDVNAPLMPLEFHPPPLVFAAFHWQEDIVNALLRAGARIDETDERGRTACHIAAESCHREWLATLLAHHPNLEAVDVDGKTALSYAMGNCYEDDGDCAFTLLEAGASVDSAARDDLCTFAVLSTAAVEALRNRGVVMRELVDDGSTLLHFAAGGFECQESEPLAELLDDCDIDLEARDRSGRTCVHVAAEYNNGLALAWFIAFGADLNVAADDGSTPLHVVQSSDIALALLAGGADACARGPRGRSPLHVAAGCSSTWIVPALLAGGADLDAADDDGVTARQELVDWSVTIDADLVEAARRGITKRRLDVVRYRACEVCIGLQSLRLDALQLCEVMLFACGNLAPLIPFHQWWKIATTVKHFRK